MRIVTFNYILFIGDLLQYLIISERVLTEVQQNGPVEEQEPAHEKAHKLTN